jgi:hypothetical protein
MHTNTFHVHFQHTHIIALAFYTHTLSNTLFTLNYRTTFPTYFSNTLFIYFQHALTHAHTFNFITHTSSHSPTPSFHLYTRKLFYSQTHAFTQSHAHTLFSLCHTHKHTHTPTQTHCRRQTDTLTLYHPKHLHTQSLRT